jgi:50S ribosomal protein L16 3-hydroxylase
MTFLKTIVKSNFIADIWQKKPHVFRQAMSEIVDLIDGNELAGLACEEEVESRIISGREALGQWSCQQGPFSDEDFAILPENNWTLLVQGLDQWLDEVRDILRQFTFLPQWRLEDIMASYAPIGGGVGPHFDYYDVFLIQVSGSRQWHLGQWCNEFTELQKNEQVKLLQHFETEVSHLLVAGDILYIPAGKAHWGVATTDDCITFSVGFRSPSEKELLSLALENIVEGLSEHKHYQDTVSSIDSCPAKINASVQQQLEDFLTRLTPEKLQEAASQAFGQLVTEPRYASLEGEQDVSEKEIDVVIADTIAAKNHLILSYPAHSRYAFSTTQLFVNGERYNVSEPLAQAICDGVIPCELLDESAKRILITLVNKGDVFIE